MNVVKITLIDNFTPSLKKSIFDAVRQSGVYEITDEILVGSDFSEIDSFFFEGMAEDSQFELQYISDGKCLKIYSDFLDDQDKCSEFEDEIKNILSDSRIKTLDEKRITLDKLTIILTKFKNAVNAQSNWYKIIAGAITVTGFATGFRGIEVFNISLPIIIMIIGVCSGFVFIGWLFRNSREVDKQVLCDSDEEAKRIFKELNDY